MLTLEPFHSFFGSPQGDPVDDSHSQLQVSAEFGFIDYFKILLILTKRMMVVGKLIIYPKTEFGRPGFKFCRHVG
jgi:hypothetical protein